jgi:hypothetical protein
MVIDFASEVFIPLGQAGADAFDDTLRWVDPNNRRFSDRLWLARQADRDAIDAILRGAVASGDDPLQAAKRLEDYLTPQAQLVRYPDDHPNPSKRGRVKPFSEQPKGVATRTPRSGMGNYAARRLARTEVSRAFNEASRRSAELNPFVEGVKWNVSGSHTEPDECDDRARRSSRGMPAGVYRFGDEPRMPSHPHCRCFWTPYIGRSDEEIVKQLRREIDTAQEPTAPRREGLFGKLVTLFQVVQQFITREAA